MAVAKKELNITKILLISYLVVSGLFIVLSAFNYFKFAVYDAGIQNGIGTTINGVIQKAIDPKCEAFTIFSGETEVALVNVKCLQQPTAQEGTQPLPPVDEEVMVK